MGSKIDKAKERRQKIVNKRKKAASYKTSLLNSILKSGSPELRMQSVPLDKTEDISFIDKMKKVLCATDNGVGLAANQIGVLRRVCVLRFNQSVNDLITMINPVIVEASSEMSIGEEGCLSYPGIFAEIKRHYWIKVQYLDEMFEKHEKEFRDLESRVIQHEIQHMLGKCQTFDNDK